MVCPSEAPHEPLRSNTQFAAPPGSTCGSMSVIQLPEEGAAGSGALVTGAAGSGAVAGSTGAGAETCSATVAVTGAVVVGACSEVDGSVGRAGEMAVCASIVPIPAVDALTASVVDATATSPARTAESETWLGAAAATNVAAITASTPAAATAGQRNVRCRMSFSSLDIGFLRRVLGAGRAGACGYPA